MTDDVVGRSGSRWRFVAWSVAASLLVLPWLAMQVTDQVVWDIVDFAILGGLLAIVGITCEMAARKTASVAYRWAVGVALAAAFMLIGGTLAVGVIGTENNAANLMFGGVLAVAIIGAFVVRFRPRGLARIMAMTAGAQVLVALIALAGRLGAAGPIWPLDILGATGGLVGFWLVSAWLFRRSAREGQAVIPQR